MMPEFSEMKQRAPFLVLGAGLMGRAIVYDLLNADPRHTLTLADADESKARSVAALFDPQRIKVRKVDARDLAAVAALMSGHAVAISAVTFHHNLGLMRAAVEARTHFCDLGHDDAIVEQQLAERGRAKHAGITAVINCGLAPGLADIMAMHLYRQFDSVASLSLRVGGLPQHPHPPLNYQLAFSAEGLLEEYTLPSTVLRNGKIRTIDALTEIETLAFPHPYDELEAFHTGGGASRLPQLLEGKVGNLDYKTIRYKGHCEKMKTLLELGFAGNEPLSVGGNLMTARELFLELLKKRLTFDEPDIVLVLVTARGRDGDKERTRSCRLIDVFDPKNSMTAMMRTTAFPTSIIAQHLYNAVLAERGVFTAEEIVPFEALSTELAKRSIVVEMRENH